MNKAELTAAIAEQAGISQTKAAAALKAFEAAVTAELAKGGAVTLVGFGSFYLTERAAREGRNPKTGEPLTITAAKTVKFKAGKALKDAVN
ncbi:MAG: HU family DNA-binding protein [Neisseria sp.]|nr:HU family DNA-binding protein [Neisseria sp.]